MFTYLANLFGMLREPTPDERARTYLEASVSRSDFDRREREIDLGLFRHGVQG